MVGPPEGPIRLYIHVEVGVQILQRSRLGALRRREDMGLLVGDWARDEDGLVYAVAWDLLTGPLKASPVSVRYTPEGLVEVARGLDAQGRSYVIVGWYHSHLDLGAFMSDRDLRTQRGSFPHDHQVAVVVDPMREVAGAFANGTDGPGTEPCRFQAYTRWGGSMDGSLSNGGNVGQK
jgi:proteasome lid subunit RPN8/RPN11